MMIMINPHTHTHKLKNFEINMESTWFPFLKNESSGDVANVVPSHWLKLKFPLHMTL